MACEIYDSLTDSGLLAVTGEPVCRFEADCPKTCQDCKFGTILKAVDQASRDAAITDEDREQSRALAILEAEAEMKRKRSTKDITEANLMHTITSLSRVN